MGALEDAVQQDLAAAKKLFILDSDDGMDTDSESGINSDYD